MDFQLKLNNDTYTFSKYHQLEDTIKGALSYWNNFGDHLPLSLTIEKVENGTETIQVKVEDGINTLDKGPGNS